MRNRKNFLIFILLLGFVSVLYCYKFTVSDSEIINLLPEERETKKKLIDPGGIVILNSDSLLYKKIKSRIFQRRKVNISSEPEEPLEILEKVNIQTKYLDSINEILAHIQYYKNRLGDIEDGGISEDFVMVNTFFVKDNLENADTIFIPATKLKIIKAIKNRYKISRFSVAKKEQKGYKIQLSSAYSFKDAQKQWQRIRQRHFKILQDSNFIVKKIKGTNEKIFYLVIAGIYPSLNYANLLCKKLSACKQNCIATK